jgi:hypothetical protein
MRTVGIGVEGTLAAVIVPARFNGPPDSGNGGYTCGLVAAELGAGGAEVSLRAPPPLETELTVERDGDVVRVSDGDTVVAEGRPADVDVGALPEPVDVGLAEATVAAGKDRWTTEHPFPTCFVCGPQRKDGLDIYPVELDERWVATWTPEEPGMAWAALDCPTSAPVMNPDKDPPIVLARLAAAIDQEPALGEPHVLVSWELEREGRKREAACALFDADGRALARSRALWIELRPA